jgi:hypothetical protein
MTNTYSPLFERRCIVLDYIRRQLNERGAEEVYVRNFSSGEVREEGTFLGEFQDFIFMKFDFVALGFSHKEEVLIPINLVRKVEHFGDVLTTYVDAVVNVVLEEYRRSKPAPVPPVETCPHCGQELPV